ncbi:GntR family transcriptional regulator [Paradevosia shaoguanensis]|jgi:DNA-binding GntR family transcriptional regulator|uniref:GntR family transcriptional regulator n=1 Tax=Paradevosia shaoguanensis TaxID=1335043 RepID=UPI000455C5ED|nr:GntR family transcriptional regulator [Paradevosia shaoguanensis]MBI4046312.1 GntR family transcriptional regulator [Devosia nanyangense]QMV03034.1 FCD domain-containing protein [Devosia sp. D6-9]CDP52824.1 Transcriptional regulator, GntR family [Devosia sp. DBB001]
MEAERQDNEGYRRFREAMHEGKLTPGMVVTQNELCDLLGISLSPLRETLVLLEEFGLVEIKPRTGIRIVYPEVAFIRENYQFRIMMEVFAMRAFAEVVKPEWLADMRKRHEDCRALLIADTPFEEARAVVVALDRQFHRNIVQSLDNRAILATHARVQDNLNMARRVHQSGFIRSQLISTMDEHLRVLESLEKRDTDGAIANLEAHFRASTHRTFAAG